ncbi:N-acetylglucosamine related transporter, NagX [Anaerovibrio sp. JC8]|uniref:acyltransferase family protein n=1 Tax=Anaerovibrio sp. JC8 TaxID=1240085 RepID=UPI000A0C9E94|nr:heparan-alpha-glucosaminide N-acetyltransferase domain-containing protein [Anaerovibrio sp. JC8]ORT99889.1 N-acetylglucosamine related transporter, NagX [Anaerovibrio sp. JC8]
MRTERINSIDIFRGLTIFVMILGNLSPDSTYTYPTLLHRDYTGVNIIDIAFPTFIFIMGVSTVFAQSLQYADWLGMVLKRTIILIILGLLVNHVALLWTVLFTPDYTVAQATSDFLNYFRPFGVLQRIALVYLIGTIIYQKFSHPWTLFIISIILMGMSTMGYHLYNPADPFGELNNISLYVDQHLQGSQHNYLQAASDPEGLYGTINATATMLLGCFAGLMIKSRQEFRLKDNNTRKKLFATGILLILAAWGWSQWEIISKPLWTAPYVLSMAGLDMILLSLMEGLTDSALFRFLLHPLKALGRNPISIYLLAEWGLALLCAVPYMGESLYMYIYHSCFFSPETPYFSTFGYTLMWDVALVMLAEIMHWKNVIIKI